MATIRIGISGWRYPPWRGTFYPKDLPQRAELQYASSILPVIEINGSFYSLQRPSSYASWYEQTPANFTFTVKAPRFITHMRRLRDVEEPVANFLASGLFNLREKLGPVLWQFPPDFTYDRARMAAFFDLLPQDLNSAARLAKKRASWMQGREQLKVSDNRKLRHAVEIRNDSFLDPTFIDLLRDHQVALVIAETARTWPMPQDVTADFLYMRLHGDKQLYKSGYSDRSLDRWATRIRAWHAGSEPPDADRVSKKKPASKQPRDIYCFFDNTDVKLRAPFDSQTLMRKLGLTPGTPAGMSAPPEKGTRTRSPARRPTKSPTRTRSPTRTSSRIKSPAGNSLRRVLRGPKAPTKAIPHRAKADRTA